jgi:hypothetical protein
MELRTSTQIAQQVVLDNETRLREFATQVNHPRFFGPNDTLQIVNDPGFPSVEELAKVDVSAPKGDPTLCWLAYQAALRVAIPRVRRSLTPLTKLASKTKPALDPQRGCP